MVVSKVIAFIKKEIVFCVAFVCAIVSSFFVPISKAYLDYIDWNTLFILFSLMAVVASFRKYSLFNALGSALCSVVHSLRSLSAILILLCFFTSMLITNDVALLTFVTFAVSLLAPSAPAWCVMYVVVLQTIAANTGSMLTPLGNPQNLFLYSKFDISIFAFMKILLPYTLLALALLLLALLVIPNTVVKKGSASARRNIDKKKIFFAMLLFILCLLSVVRLVPKSVVALIVASYLFVFDRDVLKSVDYMLLLTFSAFFIFTGNMSNISSIKKALETVVKGHELLSSVLASQIISNVPATLLLYPFSDNSQKLLIGVNIGGLGTLVASLASLISYKIYNANISANGKSNYMLVFTLMNVAFLALLLLLASILR